MQKVLGLSRLITNQLLIHLDKSRTICVTKEKETTEKRHENLKILPSIGKYLSLPFNLTGNPSFSMCFCL